MLIRVRQIGVVAVLLAVLVAGVSVASGRGGPDTLTAHLEPYAGNPVLARGAEGEWDSGFAYAGQVVYADGQFHMFYMGGEGQLGTRAAAVGYATSLDGLTWTKYARNPVPLVTEEEWMLYLNPLLKPGMLPGQTVLRATASDPTGPWTVDETPVLTIGSGRDWDTQGILPFSVVRTADEYVLYYNGFGALPGTGIGMATSPDGLTWAKYDDPATTDGVFSHSDPVFGAADNGHWDGFAVRFPSVLRTEQGWLMFYSGAGEGPCPLVAFPYQIGLAASDDGITWTRFQADPVIVHDGSAWVSSSVVVDGTTYLYYSMFNADNERNPEIGVATGTITYGETTTAPTAQSQEDTEPVHIEYIGHSSFLITAPDGTRMVTDPFAGLSYRFPRGIEADVVLITHTHADHNYVMGVEGDPIIVIDQNPEPVGLFEMTGYEALHGEYQGQGLGKVTIYVIQVGDVKMVHLAEIGTIESPDVYEAIMDADVVFVPTGAAASLQLDEIMPLMDQINARTIIPHHYALPGFEPYYGALPVDDFLAILPEDLPVVHADELLVEPGMPRQVVVLSHWDFEAE
jgi:L-ascorbate metabolism protein UlaG (beta-lactamase superfamily)